MASVAEITGKSLADIARENGMNYKTLHRRVVVSKGPLEKALSVPVRKTLPGTKEIRARAGITESGWWPWFDGVVPFRMEGVAV